jgi:hypothetical protein
MYALSNVASEEGMAVALPCSIVIRSSSRTHEHKILPGLPKDCSPRILILPVTAFNAGAAL